MNGGQRVKEDSTTLLSAMAMQIGNTIKMPLQRKKRKNCKHASKRTRRMPHEVSIEQGPQLLKSE